MSSALRIAAIVCFALAALGVPGLDRVAMLPLGLALWCGSTLA